MGKKLLEQRYLYPRTRFMGSKYKLLEDIRDVTKQFNFDTAIDLFSGSGVVSYMLKAEGARVISNDQMYLSWSYSKALIQNNSKRLSSAEVDRLLMFDTPTDRFVEQTFKGLYFTDEENCLIDRLRTNIQQLKSPLSAAIATSALMRSCAKKRPRGVFTYVGNRYDDGRRDISLPLETHFREAVDLINNAVFTNGKRNVAKRGDAMKIKPVKGSLVYMDPPYYSPLSDNHYVRRYHFLEGIARNWEGVKIQENTKTKKFANYETPFSSREGAHEAFDALFKRFSSGILLVSYSSNGLPTMDEIINLLKRYKENVEVIPVSYRYSFGNQNHKKNDNRNKVNEYLFVAY